MWINVLCILRSAVPTTSSRRLLATNKSTNVLGVCFYHAAVLKATLRVLPARPSVCLFVRPVRAPNSKTEVVEKSRICVNACQE